MPKKKPEKTSDGWFVCKSFKVTELFWDEDLFFTIELLDSAGKKHAWTYFANPVAALKGVEKDKATNNALATKLLKAIAEGWPDINLVFNSTDAEPVGQIVDVKKLPG